MSEKHAWIVKPLEHEIARLTKIAVKLAEEIQCEGTRLPDHACEQCVPDSQILIPDFVCSFHQALALKERDRE